MNESESAAHALVKYYAGIPMTQKRRKQAQMTKGPIRF